VNDDYFYSLRFIVLFCGCHHGLAMMKKVLRAVTMNTTKDERHNIAQALKMLGVYPWIKCGWFVVDTRHSLFRGIEFRVVVTSEILKYHPDVVKDIPYVLDSDVVNPELLMTLEKLGE